MLLSEKHLKEVLFVVKLSGRLDVTKYTRENIKDIFKYLSDNGVLSDEDYGYFHLTGLDNLEIHSKHSVPISFKKGEDVISLRRNRYKCRKQPVSKSSYFEHTVSKILSQEIQKEIDSEIIKNLIGLVK